MITGRFIYIITKLIGSETATCL